MNNEQGIRTEDVEDIIFHLDSSLLKYLANETTKQASRSGAHSNLP